MAEVSPRLRRIVSTCSGEHAESAMRVLAARGFTTYQCVAEAADNGEQFHTAVRGEVAAAPAIWHEADAEFDRFLLACAQIDRVGSCRSMQSSSSHMQILSEQRRESNATNTRERRSCRGDRELQAD